MIEDRINQNWEGICSRCGFTPVARRGPKTIFDVGFALKGWTVGLDVKTKDLDSKKYSDGGVCSVGNLLKFIANDQGKFVVVEFGHKHSKSGQGRDLEYIRVAPFTLLPWKAYGIENLGTGQVRLKHTVNSVWSEIEWNRDDMTFLEHGRRRLNFGFDRVLRKILRGEFERFCSRCEPHLPTRQLPMHMI